MALAAASLTLLGAVAFGPAPADGGPVPLVQPAGWPRPTYDATRNPLTGAGVALGRALFYDPGLSRDGTISCASCHLQATGFTHVDHAVSHGIEGRLGRRNSLALVNLAWNPTFHWDGGVNQLDVQALNPITNAAEMDNTLAAVVGTLTRSRAYRGQFARAFRGDSVVTGQRVLLALAQFTSGLVSYRSRYDKYVRHEAGGEFSAQELNGLALFRANCASCHREPLFTDYSFQNNGLALDSQAPDAGRAAITGRAADSLRFRVPSLRNIERTAPYMHDGRFRRLRDVLHHYTAGLHQSATLAPQLRAPLRLSPDEQKDLTAFLLTLTDHDFLTDSRFAYPGAGPAFPTDPAAIQPIPTP
ncbi:c-type cytochrome [Hymenobacter sp. BT662]|uniref:C-type cytochrome n=1 Tax=Hymenobacter ruricola TaxID=2791023 RepID=A0ABS0I6Y5_9BACT|nr:c-type cytochrome [Hymenobacter ruricola]